MINESELISLIAAIYEAAVDFQVWPDTLGRIAAAFGVPSAGMARQGKTLADCWGMSSGIEPAAMKSYVEYYHGVNPIWQSVPNTPAGTVQTDTMVISRKHLVRTEFFNDYMSPQRIGGLLNAVVLLEEGRQTVVTMHGRDQFEAEHVALYKLITPHLQRAVQINLKLARAAIGHAAATDVLSRLEEGLLFVDVNARIIFANPAAEGCFVGNTGLRQTDGILHSSSSSETAALHALISQCREPGPKFASGGFTSFMRGPRRLPLTIMVAPIAQQIPDWLDSERPVAIVFVTDPERVQTPPSSQLRDQFGLTRAQAAFALEILKGDGIQAAADRLSISRATARTHLSRVFDKTGTRRQTDLVRLLLSTKFLRKDTE